MTAHDQAAVGTALLLLPWVIGLWLAFSQPHIEADWTAHGAYRDTWRQAQGWEGGR